MKSNEGTLWYLRLGVHIEHVNIFRVRCNDPSSLDYRNNDWLDWLAEGEQLIVLDSNVRFGLRNYFTYALHQKIREM